MPWEQVYRGGHQPDASWDKEPMVSLTKAAIVLNRPLLDALDLKVNDHVALLIDRKNYKVGLKIAETEEDRLGAHVLRKGAGGAGRGTAMMIATKKIATTFPLAIGKVYKVTMPNGSMIVEVQLPCPRLPESNSPTS